MKELLNFNTFKVQTTLKEILIIIHVKRNY